jgi:hypothetical protein
MAVKPEKMSLDAHSHIKNYLASSNQDNLTSEDLNAVLRLSQHLRVFGLLSAIGYLNQSNAQAGRVRLRTVPVWSSLLGQMIAAENFNPDQPLNPSQLRNTVTALARDQSQEYMAAWRRSLTLSNHWNFWARAYSGESVDVLSI